MRTLPFVFCAVFCASPLLADTIAFWNQNNNSLPAGGFGFTTSSFPQAADTGSGSLTLANFDTASTGGTYTYIQSFGGTTTNDQAAGAGGSLSPQGGTNGTGNNGMSIIMQVSTTGFEDIIVSWAQRGTATGFNSRVFAYSTDGTNYTDFATDSGALGSAFVLESYDLSAVAAIESAPTVFFRITLSGATAATGNNRLDNLLITGTPAGPDTTPPTDTTFLPADDAAGVPITATPSITFNEPIRKGSGNVVIKKSSDNSVFETIDVASGSVTVSGNSVTVTPAVSFANSTGYYVEMTAGVIEDVAGNDYAGLSGDTAWNFTTLAASASPMGTETFTTQNRVTPTGSSATTDYYGEGNGQGSFALYGFGTFNFSKLDFGLSGASVIDGVTSAEFKLRQNSRSFTTGTQLEFFLTTDSSTGKTFDPAIANGINGAQYSFAPVSLGQFTYTPTNVDPTFETFTLDLSGVEPALISRLNTGEDFSIILAVVNAPDAVTFSGKNNTFDPGDPELKLTVTETTGTDTTPPTVAFFIPADNSGGLPVSSNVKVSFNELIQEGTGDIVIHRSDNSVFETIPVSGANVTVNLGTVTIDPVNPLESAGNYYVLINAGAIQDVSGNAFGGINDSSTWNFSTAQPPIAATGPFSLSENARPGTVVGDLNPAVAGKEGIRYALIGGSGGATLMPAVPGNGYRVDPVFTIGDTILSSTGALNASSAGSFSPPGTPDGLGAYAKDANTIRVFMNHEIEVPTTGSGAYPYTLANGTVISKGGARVSYIDIDKSTRAVVDGGLAIARMYDRAGNVVTNPSQLELGGLDRMCSASLYEPESFGIGLGLADRTYITGEETSTAFGHPHGGTFWALDTSNGDFWALPDFGRGSWENAALIDTGDTSKVAFLLGDDAQQTPLYLYVGTKSTATGANFIQRNGLTGGQLYIWKADNGNTTPQQFNGTGASRNGSWVAINARNAALANTAGHDALGYKNDTTLHSEAASLGAFRFSRPEDLTTNPADGSIAAFTSTGRGTVYPADNWGDTYTLAIGFNVGLPTTGTLTILYDGDDAGGGQFGTPEEGLRCPDNLDWATDGFIYVQEDQSNQQGSFGAAGFETSIWRLDSSTGQALRVAEIDRSTVLPLGSTDSSPGDVGNWESSGIIGVSHLFGELPGTLFLFDIQAHSIGGGLISSKNLAEGGQLCFLEKGSEKGAFALNPNTGVITLANPDAINLGTQPQHSLRIQAYDGTNSTLAQATVNITNSPVAKSNDLKVATYNTSLFRNSNGALVSDLSGVTHGQAADMARVIQRNNPDVILVNEFDYDADGLAAKRFRENYLEVGQSGENPVVYPYAFVAPSNTGIPSGFDLDNNGQVITNPASGGYGEDSFGFGTHPGQYAFMVLSKFPIDTANIRTFQKFLWKDMPGALLPDDPDFPSAGDWYSAAELNAYRLSSKNHADVPVLVNGTAVHILASHPTPPVFDDPASGQPWKPGVDHNGRRNSDEIRFWADYVNPASSAYIYDDTETPATASGGLSADTRFVIAGDQNADQNEGDSTPPAILSVINSPLVNGAFVPAGGSGPDPDDTAAFSGGVRVDYTLPSSFGLTVNFGNVFWPPPGDPISAAVGSTDHHMVFVNLTISGVQLPPNVDLATYYLPAQKMTGAPLQNALHGIIDGHTIIEYNNVDEIMRIIDETSSGSGQLRLIYSNATLPANSFSGAPGTTNATSWNREHVWPRNDGVGDDGPDFSDVHHLFPAQVNVNSLRSALFFDESTNIESDPFAPESFKDNNSWEPLDRDKGIVARAQLYMMTRYDGFDPLTTDLALNNNPVFAGTDSGVLDTLIAWNRSFPPDNYEKSRNNAIYGGVAIGPVTYAQGNRNPFVDFPQFADALFLVNSTSFGKWQVENFTIAQLADPAASGPTADPDGDELTGLLEFAFGLNPNSSDNTANNTDVPNGVLLSRGNPTTYSQATPNGQDFRLVFIRLKNPAASGLTYTPQFSPDMERWENSSTIPTVIASDGEYEAVSIPYPFFVFGEQARFSRVGVTKNP